jgi:hypothetical protein
LFFFVLAADDDDADILWFNTALNYNKKNKINVRVDNIETIK